MKWFKRERPPSSKSRDARGPAKATGSPDPSDTDVRFENPSQQDTEFTAAPRLRTPAPPAGPISVPPTLGRYEVRRLLGAGGFGSVYLGHDAELDRPVAIKVLRAASGHLADAERSRQEARRLASLHHPGIVTVHDMGVYQGQVYIVSDYVEGPDLHRWMRDNRASWSESARIAAAVSDALSHAHARRIVHRDVKPANIILAGGRTPVLVDFGLALSEDQAGGGEKGLISGTPHYMSPEQAGGVAHRIDGRTDIYSLGVVLYELLTGRLPFPATDLVELLRQVRDDEPQPPRQLVRDIPLDLERACLKALAKHQQDRYTTAADFAEDLQRVFQTPASPAPPAAAAAPAQATPTPTPAPTPVQMDIAPPTPPRAATATPTPTPSSVRRAREAERRQLTVLICGCEEFTSEAYLELDAEDQARVLHAFQQASEAAVGQFGGTVLQCTDEGLLACFGFPVAYEDAAGRAARAGLAIVDTMTLSGGPIGPQDTLELHPWVGIHTGTAVVESKAGAVSLVGEARNVAVRLEDVAVAGQVVCTEASHRLFQGRFHCASLGRQKIKSVTHAVELFRIEHIAVTGSPIDAVAPAELSPLTGRDQEIGLLADRWEQAREGMGQVVLLIGEAGLGKSRLVHTMKQRVLGQMIEGELDAPVIEWRCSPHFQHTGLYPAIDFYERALGIDREEPPAARFDRLLHRLQQYDLARPETVPLWASLLSLPTPDRFPPLSLSPVRQREETFRAMLEWLHTRAARKPFLFVVEDLHWVDASTLEFLGQFLAEGLHDSILTLLTFRPEFTTPWPAVAHQTSLALNRLTRRQVGDLMRTKTASPLPDAVVDQVYDRTGGVPLFVEEFTKMVQESGAAAQAGDGGVGRQGLSAHEIPATLQDLVMARLDRMEGERDVAQLAATLGREFSYELLAAVATLDEPTLQGELAKLVQAEILYPKGRPPRCSYIFKHALLEDALYNALVKGTRQQFHRRIAEVLDAQFPQTAETRPELLAHHFSEAGLAEKGAGYWLKAGLRSRLRSANLEAIGHLTKGLSQLDTLPVSAERDARKLELLNPLGSALIAARGYATPEVGPVFQRARELCDRVGSPQQQFAIMMGAHAWHVVRGDIRLCTDLAAEAMEFARGLNGPGILMEARFCLLTVALYRGDFTGAREHSERAISEYDDCEPTQISASITGENPGVAGRCYLALSLWHLGYPDQALTLIGETIELARTIGHPFTLAYALHHAGWLRQHCELGEAAQAAADEQIDIAAQQGFALWHATATLYRGSGLVLQGNLEGGLALLVEGLESYRATGAELALPYYFSVLGDGYTRAGHFGEALTALDGGLSIVEKNDDRFAEAELHRLRGELLLGESYDRFDESEDCFMRAIETARRQHSKAWELRATTSLARLWQRQGRRDEARAALAAVYGSYTEGFTMPDLMDARATLESLAEPVRT